MLNKVFDTEQAATYYNDAAVSEFYQQCWGGEDIHIGLYVTGNKTIGEASAAMTQHLIVSFRQLCMYQDLWNTMMQDRGTATP